VHQALAVQEHQALPHLQQNNQQQKEYETSDSQ
jgi:hypothetical protein